jgi:hypothetical protein
MLLSCCRLQNMAKATYGTEPAPIPCSAFNHDGTIYAYALSYDWSKGFAVCWVQALPADAACIMGRRISAADWRCSSPCINAHSSALEVLQGTHMSHTTCMLSIEYYI